MSPDPSMSPGQGVLHAEINPPALAIDAVACGTIDAMGTPHPASHRGPQWQMPITQCVSALKIGAPAAPPVATALTPISAEMPGAHTPGDS
jgi:hypothetical protein